jgi:hypothetical protein
MLEGAKQEGTSDVAYSRRQTPVLEDTKNGTAEQELCDLPESLATTSEGPPRA